MNYLRRVWAEIDIDALKHNLEVVKSHCKDNKIMAVVKADAYGHGVKNVVPALREAGVYGFAVSNLCEAIELRELSVKEPILILGYTPPENAKELIENDIIQCVYSYDYGLSLAKSCAGFDKRLKCYLKVDTGMGRLGFNFRENGDGYLELISTLNIKNLDFIGIFTHFADADKEENCDDGFTDIQYKRFVTLIEKLKAEGVNLIPSCCNSAAIMDHTNLTKDTVCRPGIILYGLEPDSKLSMPELTPVMTLKSVVTFVKDINTGETLSYGRTFKAEKKMTVATVAVGYADGYPRALSNKAYVLINGKKAKVLGRVCMDQMLIDVTGIDTNPGDEVILFGKDLSPNILADMANTISYEIICGVGKRVPRIVVNKK
ncbi:MAG: alanine racemase [Clostridia bacterium]|nr:alanine racemase [Clostridia bacterium]